MYRRLIKIIWKRSMRAHLYIYPRLGRNSLTDRFLRFVEEWAFRTLYPEIHSLDDNKK